MWAVDDCGGVARWASVKSSTDFEWPQDFAFFSTLVAASALGLVVFSRAASFDIVITMTTTWSLAFFLLYELHAARKSGF